MADKVKKILCIDDDEDVLVFLKAVLEKNGYCFVEAHSASEGIKKFSLEMPDLVVVDLMMEEVDAGLNLAAEIRKKNNDVPIYMLSSLGDSLNSSIDTSGLGLSGVFQKPLRPEILISTIKEKI